jgi:hypothetical protein
VKLRGGPQTRISLTDTVIRDTRPQQSDGGTQLFEGGTLDLAAGRIQGNPIGINVQDADFELGDTTDVTLRNNGQRLDAQELAVPEAVGPE